MTAPTTDSAMYQTMHRQPDDLRRVLATGWEPARQAADLLAGAKRTVVTGIGTSDHAALVGSWLLRAAGADARAVLSSDFALYPESYPIAPGDAVVVMAHTGVKSLSAVFFGEPFGPAKLLGAGLVMAGLVIARTRVWRRPAAKGSTT